jgi:hypothetical protein
MLSSVPIAFLLAPNAGLSRREAVGFVPLVLPQRSGGKGHRLSPAFSLSEAKGERI